MADLVAEKDFNGAQVNIHTKTRTINSQSGEVQRVQAAVAETFSPQIVSQGTTGADILAANNSRVYAQITARDGDIYIASSTGNLASDSTRRKVKQGESWETTLYTGKISAKGVAGTVTVEIEEIS